MYVFAISCPADANRQALARRLDAMLQAGLQVPALWDAPKGLSQAEAIAWRARGTIGHVAAARLATDGTLFVGFDAPVASDRQQLLGAKLAPTIRRDFVDGAGRRWPGPSILFLTANSSRPVQLSAEHFGGNMLNNHDSDLLFNKWSRARRALERDGLHIPDDLSPIDDLGAIFDCLHAALLTRLGIEEDGQAVEAHEPGGGYGAAVAMSMADRDRLTHRLLAMESQAMRLSLDAGDETRKEIRELRKILSRPTVDEIEGGDELVRIIRMRQGKTPKRSA